ncbi:MAG: M50 family metallopeptidase [Minisyncoccia bacterium]
MFVLILTLLGISFLILAHEAGHFFVARKCGMKVDEFGFGLPPKIFGIKKGETTYSINLLPFGGFVKIAGENDNLSDSNQNEKISIEDKKRLFYYQRPRNKALVTIAGIVVNFLIGWILISSVIAIGKPFSIIITDVLKDSPAAAAGLQKNDLILGYQNEEDLKKFISLNPNKEVVFKIQRNGKVKDITLKIGEKNNQGFLGIYFVGGEIKKQRIDKAFYQGFLTSLNIFKMNAYGLYYLFSNLFTQGKLIEGVVGPVGIISFSKQVGEISLVYLLNLLGIISVSLAFINLIPFPALDGGRLLFILIEKIKGKALSHKVEAVANTIGFALLLLLIIAVTFRDVKGLF